MGLLRDIATQKINHEELLSGYLSRIEQSNNSINAYISSTKESTDSLLKSVEDKKGKRLFGVPIAVKDNISVRDWEVTCGSNILKNYIAPYSATVIEKLIEEGAILLGRVNMDEFAFGSSCETSHYGPTKNPWNLDCVPGGSSGGSAASVAADLASASLGSDTGGSIRQPASFCGIVGLKPTYGRVSRYGLVAFASSLDQIGPLTHSVEDAALLLEAIAGFDSKDSTSANVDVPAYTESIGQSVKGFKVGIPKEFFSHELSKDLKESIDKAIEVLSKEGVEFKEISLPHTDYAVSAYYVVGPSEASSNLARFDGVKYGNRDTGADNLLDLYTQTREKGFGAEAKRRIILGTFALSSGYYDAYYLKAMKIRRKMIEDFNNAFEDVDAIISPTTIGGAFKIGEKTDDPLSMYLSDIFTISANLTGIPAISLPCGLTKDKLPLGIQFMAKPFDEASLFKISSAYEKVRGFEKLTPESSHVQSV